MICTNLCPVVAQVRKKGSNYVYFVCYSFICIGKSIHWLEVVGTSSIELEHVFVVLPESLAVRDSEKSNANLSTVCVHEPLHINAHSTCTLIKNSKLIVSVLAYLKIKTGYLWLVIE